MFCLQGTGGFGSMSICNKADIFKEPNMFAAICLKGDKNNIVRVLEGPVPIPKIWGSAERDWDGSGQGLRGKNYGLPRFRECEFSANFPFAHISQADDVPVKVEIEGFSPFTPGNADDSSLPAASVKYTFHNDTDHDIDAVFYFSAMQFMGIKGGEGLCFVRPCKNGVILEQENFDFRNYNQSAFAITLDCTAASNADFYRGGWWDPVTMRWNSIAGDKVSLRTVSGNIEVKKR